MSTPIRCGRHLGRPTPHAWPPPTTAPDDVSPRRLTVMRAGP
jgi:hypothetical protein